MVTQPPLTRRQRQILDFYRAYTQEHGISPTLEEVAQSFGVNKVTIFGHVSELERKNHLSRAAKGINVITVPENRWERVDIKTVGLLPNVLARQMAKEAGAQEALFVDEDGFIKEGAATNAWIITRDGVLVTRPAEYGILRGVTRTTLFDVAASMGMAIEERPFTVEEAMQAREVFITAATTLVMPVVRIDDVAIANGEPGSIALSLRQAFFDIAEKTVV